MTDADAPGSSRRVLIIRQQDRVAAADDLARSVELLHAVADGSLAEDRVVRLYTPAPTVAMSRRESRLPGFAAAARESLARGFTPEIRPTGGRAVAYDDTCVVFDVIQRERQDEIGQERLFAKIGEALVQALHVLGVDAHVGIVPGEYCPGEYSVNAGGRVKMIGTSQRSIRGARLLSGMLPLGDVDSLAEVLAMVNAALDLEWDPRTFGSLHAESPGVSRFEVENILVAALASW